jgi:hypothetical protein
MRKNSIKTVLMLALVIALGCFFSACAMTGSAQKADDMGIAANIAYDLPASAKITKVSYLYEKYKGAPTLHIEVGIKNVTDHPQRFRVNILLPEGPAVGGMYPRKKKAIEAGATLERKFPVYLEKSKFAADFMPTGFTIMVKEL